MERALEMLRKIDAPTEEIHTSILANLICVAGWEVDLQLWDAAVNHYEEALLIDPSNSEAQAKLLKLLLSRDQDKPVYDLLVSMNSTKSKNADVSQLAATLIPLLQEEGSEAIFNTLFTVCQKNSFFTPLLQDIDAAIDFAQSEEREHDRAWLLLFKGIALYRYDEREERDPEAALSLWEKIGTLTFKEKPWMFERVASRSLKFLSSYQFERARSSPNPTYHIEKMESYANTRYRGSDLCSRTYLGSYYGLKGDFETAKNVYLGDFKNALALLSDDDEENDYQGYYQMADILMHSGDTLNALSAWSLLGPTDGKLPAEEADANGHTAEDNSDEEEETDTEEHNADNGNAAKEKADEENAPLTHNDRSGDLSNFCDGNCGLLWHYADDFYCCKACPDIQFCAECLVKLQAGTLKHAICNSQHERLHVPKWDDNEFKETREKKVKVGGELKGDTRVGYRTVTLEEWLNLLRDDWGLSEGGKYYS